MNKTLLAFALFLSLPCGSLCAWQLDGQKVTQGFEGFSSTPYYDTRGILTVGYGFNCNRFKKCPSPMTRLQAQILFLSIYEDSISRAKRFTGSRELWQTLLDNEKIVLTDMAYNLGNRLFKFRKLQHATRTRNQYQQIKEMKNSNWYKQTGNRPKQLIQLLKG